MMHLSGSMTISPPSKGGIDLVHEINKLRKKRNAVILAHYYQHPDIQDVADFIGDSLELCRKAAATEADVIVFCGVHFMAETAKILNPNKTVLIPDVNAGCSLADDCPSDKFEKFRAKYPDHFVVTYINCTADVKAQSDLICTSSNAVELIKKIPKDKEILFSPDKNLGKWVQAQCGRELTIWEGSCVVHENFSEEALLKLQLEHPEAKTIAHPECLPNLLGLADYIGSTTKLLKYADESESSSFIVVTEPGILHQMRLKIPSKIFYDVPGIDGCSCNECPYMRLNNLENLHTCLLNMEPKIEMEEDIRLKALRPIELMLEMSS